MTSNKYISDSIQYIGVDDPELPLFESQYMLENGMVYNSYLIRDEKIAVMDAVDARKIDEWMARLSDALAGRTPDYLVVLHVEPDHSAGVKRFLDTYPEAKVVGNAKTFTFLSQFFPDFDFGERKVVVKEADTLCLGNHTLRFIIVPMVHWPETMVAYDASDRVLFSADAFGKFGVYDADADDWTCEARRYYFNIVGKYGAPVQVLLKKIADLDIRVIAPLHGPVLSENLQFYIDKYHTWSSYEPEDKGVFIAVASIHGHTLEAAEMMAEKLRARGVKVAMSDLSREDIAEAVEDAFRYDRLLLAAASYDGGVFTPMEFFLSRLKHKNYQKRRVAILENGTWAPTAAKTIKKTISEMSNVTLVEPVVTIRSAYKPADDAAFSALCDALCE
ncbi:MAG: FprA family A-type flavoprotein [Sodaliphilus sp.]|nr:FprA family A-type flavoprotein [Sodaliphilus sp.]